MMSKVMRKKSIVIVIAVVAVAYLLYSFVIPGTGEKYYTDAGVSATQANQLNQNLISNSRRNIITETVANSSPAVVGINVTEIRQYRDPFLSPFFDDPFFRQFFGDRTYSQKVKELGSGFIISSDGYILTNDHVAGNGSEIVVTLTSGKHYNAKIIGTDPVSDICLLKIEGDNFPFLKLGNSDDIITGEWVIALGNPFGLFEVNNKPTVTVGVISATNMNLNKIERRYYLNMIQTDAAINGGNSGGPLVNSIGEVIGMNTLIYTAGSQGNIGLGFAIPINKVKKILDEIKEKGKIERDFYTGLSVQNIDDVIARYYKLENTRGVIVTKVLRESPAFSAGIRPGDVILKIDDNSVDNEQSLMGILQEYRTGQKVKVTVVRDNEEKVFTMKLERGN